MLSTKLSPNWMPHSSSNRQRFCKRAAAKSFCGGSFFLSAAHGCRRAMCRFCIRLSESGQPVIRFHVPVPDIDVAGFGTAGAHGKVRTPVVEGQGDIRPRIPARFRHLGDDFAAGGVNAAGGYPVMGGKGGAGNHVNPVFQSPCRPYMIPVEGDPVTGNGKQNDFCTIQA